MATQTMVGWLGMVGLISSSRKRRYRGLESPPLPVDSKNPWGSLAEAWRTDEQDELWQDNLQGNYCFCFSGFFFFSVKLLLQLI